MMVGFPPGGPTDTLARILADGMKNALGQTDRDRERSAVPAARLQPAVSSMPIRTATRSELAIGRAMSARRRSIRSITTSSRISSRSRCWPPRHCGSSARRRLAARRRRRELDHLGEIEVEHESDHIRHRRHRQRRATVRHLLRAEDRRAIAIRALSRRRAGDSGFDRPARSICPASKRRRRLAECAGRSNSRPIAVMSEKRWDKSPNTPTMIESGVPGLTISFWHGLWTTKGTPQGRRRSPRCRRADPPWPIPPCGSGSITLGQVIFPREQQNAGRARGVPQGRDRQVVADHQSGRHQDRIAPTYRRRAQSCRGAPAPRHADRHRGGGDDQRDREREGGKQFDAGAAPFGKCLFGNRRSETDLPGQLSHGGRHPRRDRNHLSRSFANQFCVVAKSRSMPAPVRPDLGEAIEEERQFRGFG